MSLSPVEKVLDLMQAEAVLNEKLAASHNLLVEQDQQKQASVARIPGLVLKLIKSASIGIDDKASAERLLGSPDRALEMFENYVDLTLSQVHDQVPSLGKAAVTKVATAKSTPVRESDKIWNNWTGLAR